MRRLFTLPVLVATVSAGCGGGGGSTPKPQPVPVEQVRPEVSYEQVRRLTLADPDLECRKPEDQDLGPVPPGEVYTRLVCDGDAVLDYVAGAVAYETQGRGKPGALDRLPLWHEDEGTDPARVSLPLAGPRVRSALPDLARRIRESCGCGAVVKPPR